MIQRKLRWCPTALGRVPPCFGGRDNIQLTNGVLIGCRLASVAHVTGKRPASVDFPPNRRGTSGILYWVVPSLSSCLTIDERARQDNLTIRLFLKSNISFIRRGESDLLLPFELPHSCFHPREPQSVECVEFQPSHFEHPKRECEAWRAITFHGCGGMQSQAGTVRALLTTCREVSLLCTARNGHQSWGEERSSTIQIKPCRASTGFRHFNGWIKTRQPDQVRTLRQCSKDVVY